ncbi:unnamed protein product, partial [marine sediment metagenome]
GWHRIKIHTRNYIGIIVAEDDRNTIDRIYNYLTDFGYSIPKPRRRKPSKIRVPIYEPSGPRIPNSTKNMLSMVTQSNVEIEKMKDIVLQTNECNYDWCRGLLAGFFDTDGCLHKTWELSYIQIKNQDKTFSLCEKAINLLGFSSRRRWDNLYLINNYAFNNNILKYLSLINPALNRKKNLIGMGINFEPVKVTNIEKYNGDYVAIQTDTKTLIANGLLTHNCFIGPKPTSDRVFVVNQRNVKTGTFDEHKIMMGFKTEEEARAGYLANYEKG